MPRIKITAGDVSAFAELNDSETAKLIWDEVPIEASASTWGDEIYFGIPVHTGSETGAKAEVEVGDIAYWPPGNAFCIFFGPTPASSGEKPVAASPVNLVGKVEGDATVFGAVRSRAKVTIEKAE